MAMDLDSYLAKYAPPPDDSQDWRQQLQAAAFALMGARKGQEFNRLGEAGLLAMNVGQDLKRTRREEHRGRMQDVSAAWKMSRDEEERARKEQINKMLLEGLTGGAGGPPQGAMPPGAMPTLPGAGGPPMGGSVMAGAMPPGMPQGAPPMPMPGGSPAAPANGYPGINRMAAVAALNGHADVGKLIQGNVEKAAEYGALKVGPNGLLYNSGGVVGQASPDGAYFLNGKYNPPDPQIKAAMLEAKETEAKVEVGKQQQIKRNDQSMTPFVIPGTNTVTNALDAAQGRSAPLTPQQQELGSLQAKSGQTQVDSYIADAKSKHDYAAQIKQMRSLDPGDNYSGGLSEFQLFRDNVLSAIPGAQEYVDKNKLANAQAFEAGYKGMILTVMAPLMKGPMSDRDVKIMQASGPGLFMLPAGRQVMYDILENNAERAQKVADAAAEHFAKNGHMRGFNGAQAAGAYKPVLSIAARGVPEEDQQKLRGIVERYAAGDKSAEAAVREAVKLKLLLL